MQYNKRTVQYAHDINIFTGVIKRSITVALHRDSTPLLAHTYARLKL
jgi:hypothetical protein